MDAESTRVYVAAKYRLMKDIGGSYSSREAAAKVLVKQVQSECPNVLAGAPADGGELRREAVAQLEYALRLALRPAYLGFATATGGLRWKSRELTQEVARQAIIVRASVSIAQPNLCSDAREFVSSEYRIEPAATRRFLAEQDALEAEQVISRGRSAPRDLAMAIASLLVPYETPHERALVPPPAESQVHEQDFVNALDQLMLALGLSER